MPKDRSSRVSSYESQRRRSRASPYFLPSHGRSGCSRRTEESSVAAAVAATKQTAEWEEVRCPVCMDHPHNAVLLVCSSHEKGCRPFMCDTSSRHSNCYDQYRKASKESTKDLGAECSECQQPVQLSCPLCRGPVSDCIKDYDARKYMNSKVRLCTTESCEFRGAYHELRKHARVEHPTVRPMEVDPDRQRDWRRMEQQRDIGDLMSMLRSGFGSGIDDDGGSLGATEEGEEDIAGRPPPSITMVLIMSSGASIMQYLSEHSRAIIVVSRRRGIGSGGDAEATTLTDSEGGDEHVPSADASAGSQHSSEEEADELRCRYCQCFVREWFCTSAFNCEGFLNMRILVGKYAESTVDTKPGIRVKDRRRWRHLQLCKTRHVKGCTRKAATSLDARKTTECFTAT
ncbi:hypothetical protein BS78_03G193300 [Paspalum vaginatum]|nr:hypothetical protein BS78_03G193300 [Paspalum vaginatum]